MNAYYYDPDFWWESGPYGTWDLGIAPLPPDAVSFRTYYWYYYPWFATDDNGYPHIQPQRLYSQESLIQDLRSGNSGALASYDDLVDLGSDQQPLPPPPPLQLDIEEASALEGDRGTKTLRTRVTLNRSCDQAVTVAYQTVNGTAAAPKDYTAASRALTFQPGETRKTIAVFIKGDRQRERDEAFTVRLASAVDANLGRSVGTATNLNDDER